MLFDPKIGDQVKIRTDSKWYNIGDNPDNTVTGYIIGFDGHWVEVIWIGNADALNYKAFDLDSAV